MTTKESLKRAQEKYAPKFKAKIAKFLSIRLYKEVDDDIINHLAMKSDVSDYLKKVIREDMKRG